MKTMFEIRTNRTKTLAEEPSAGHNRWHRDIPPVIRCDAFDEVVLEARDAFDGQIGPDASLEVVAKPDLGRLHPLAEPIHIEGAEPGDLFDMEVVDIKPDRYGYTVEVPCFGFLPDEFTEPFKVSWEIAEGWATSRDLPGVRIPGSPFMGTTGPSPGQELLAAIDAPEQASLDRGGFVLPPSAASAIPADPHIVEHALRTVPPREQAEDIDVEQLSKAAHLLIQVEVPGALFSARDAHYAQGDCETCGTAIEMNATLHVRSQVQKGEAARRGTRDPWSSREDYYLPSAVPRRFYVTTSISVTTQAHREN